ncbi:RNA export factor gle2 [Conglomerata obtusa]
MTCGSDGSVILYDKSVRQKLFGESFKVPVCCGAFSGDGSIFAAGLGYDWSRGYEVTGDKPAIKVVQMNTTGAKI